MDKKRVVITGIGAVTPVGHSAQESWSAVKEGKCGIGPITLFDTSEQKVKIAGEVKNFNPEDYLDKKDVKHAARFTHFTLISAKQAYEDSGLDMEKENLDRCGAVISTGIGGIAVTEEEHSKGLQKGFDRVSPFYIPMTICNMAAGLVAIKYGLRGMCTSPVTACAGGTNAVGDAFHYIRDGYGDIVFCGGAEAAITPLSIGGFTSMKALAVTEDVTRASIPFDKERSGFVMGEGAGILILEEYEHAVARGAKIYAEVVGYGATCDAYHMTAPVPGGEGAARAMRAAIDDAGVDPEQVDYINAHGTSTKMNDSGEVQAIKAVFGDYAKKLMISSTKSMTGHMLGATGAVEAIFSVLTVHDSFVPPTINYKVPDEELDLDFVPNKGRAAEVKYALSNSFGFGGHNACVLFKKVED